MVSISENNITINIETGSPGEDLFNIQKGLISTVKMITELDEEGFFHQENRKAIFFIMELLESSLISGEELDKLHRKGLLPGQSNFLKSKNHEHVK